MSKTAVIFTRVSSQDNRQNTARQVADLSVYAANNGLNVLKIYEEKISGAAKKEERIVLNECLGYCIANKVNTILASELSRIGRSTAQIINVIQFCIDNKINVYLQKENLSLFQADGKPSPFIHIFISVLSCCAELERTNIQFRLNSGLQKYLADGGKVGRKKGSVKSVDIKKMEYGEVIKELKKGIPIRKVAKLTDVSVSTVQRIKKEFGL